MDASRIAAVPAFADLPASELEALARVMGEVEVESGARVVTAYADGTAVYFIEEGNADVLNDDGGVTVALGTGDVFGEIGLLFTGQRIATVVARTPMRLLSLSGYDFDRIRARVPDAEQSLRRLGLERSGR